MPSSAVIWEAVGAFVISFFTSISSLYVQLNGTTDSIGKGGYIVSFSGAMVAAFVAGRSARQKEQARMGICLH